jgi:hypothetical protein
VLCCVLCLRTTTSCAWGLPEPDPGRRLQRASFRSHSGAYCIGPNPVQIFVSISTKRGTAASRVLRSLRNDAILCAYNYEPRISSGCKNTVVVHKTALASERTRLREPRSHWQLDCCSSFSCTVKGKDGELMPSQARVASSSLTLTKPISAAFSRKQRRQIIRLYLRITPRWVPHFRHL